VLSIVAGASLRKLAAGLKHKAIVRSMPNTPGQIGEGITVWTASHDTSASQRELARQVLGAMGEEIFVEDESYLDMATALSGNGPAYVFLFTEALIDAGVHGYSGASQSTGAEDVERFGRSMNGAAPGDPSQPGSPGGTRQGALLPPKAAGLPFPRRVGRLSAFARVGKESRPISESWRMISPADRLCSRIDSQVARHRTHQTAQTVLESLFDRPERLLWFA
jgi:hypothetical protein